VIAAAEGGQARRWDLPPVLESAPLAETGERLPKTPVPAAPDPSELAALRETAQREGFQVGLAAGRGQAAAELAEERARLGALLQALAEPLAAVDQQVTDELVGLACDIARQLLRRELATDPGQIVAVVRETLALLPVAERRVTLQLHPDDAELVERVLVKDNDGMPWKIQQDPLLTRGGCRVSTGDSRIDATVESRLGAVIARVLGDSRQHQASP
jgi:flagellar assembly protein FliH